MKKLLLIICIALAVAANAQVSKVSIQASGLTCAMCSNSINKSLKTLDFVESVTPNIKMSSFEITFKPRSNVDFDRLKKKVEDAGFAVANFVATVNFNKADLKNQPIKIGDKTFYIVNAKDQSISGVKQVRVIDRGFVSNKEYKKNASAISATGNGVYNVTI